MLILLGERKSAKKSGRPEKTVENNSRTTDRAGQKCESGTLGCTLYSAVNLWFRST